MMTRGEIMALSGRELDAAVAERLFGHKVARIEPIEGNTGFWIEREGHWTRVGGKMYPVLDLLPHYSQDLAVAMAAVEAESNHRPDEEFVLVRLRDGRWFAGWFDGFLDPWNGIIDGHVGGGHLGLDAASAVDGNPATAVSRAVLFSWWKREGCSGDGEGGESP